MTPATRSRRNVALLVLSALTIAGLTAHLYAANLRQQLFDELTPVRLSNCEMARFGAEHDGGYLLCGNLAADVESVYSYGIAGRDSFGCDASRQFETPVHQYDCFDPRQPTCEGGTFIFHDECIGPRQEEIEGRVFDSLVNQIESNGDHGKEILVKMDVEGSEWDSLLETPDEQLARINQIAIEFHRVASRKYVKVLKKLKRHFYVVDLHFNNYSCRPLVGPFPGRAYEVLLVNKRIAQLAPSGDEPPIYSHPLNSKNKPEDEDCQYQG